MQYISLFGDNEQIEITDFPNECPYCHNVIHPKFYSAFKTYYLEDKPLAQIIEKYFE